MKILVNESVSRRRLLAWGALSMSGWATARDGAAWRALLVGVSDYPSLPGHRLKGPANDVILMSASLRFLGVPDRNIAVLSEAGGPAAWPTRARILQELGKLSEQAAPGELVVIYFSGHGTQVPQSKPGRALRPEPDGLDEVFLPRDTAVWDPKSRRVQGGILDDEIGLAIDRILARKARVWAIFDTCHAGNVTRAPAADRAAVYRFVPPGELGIPLALPRLRPVPVPATAPAGLVAFFAAGSDEPAPEELFPDPLQRGSLVRYGVFTYELHHALVDWRRGTFHSLAERLQTAYLNRPFPSPQFEGELGATPPAPKLLAMRPG